MTETQKKMCKSNFNLRSLRISLKYRPGILKLILKMRQCIRNKALIITKLRHRLKEMENNSKPAAVEDNATSINTERTDANRLQFMESKVTPESKQLSINEDVIIKPEIENISVQTDNVAEKTGKNELQAMEAEITAQILESNHPTDNEGDIPKTEESSLQTDTVADIIMVPPMETEATDQTSKQSPNTEHTITKPRTENRSMQTDNITTKTDTNEMPSLPVEDIDHTSELKLSAIASVIKKPHTENRSAQTENITDKIDQCTSMEVEDTEQKAKSKHSSIKKPKTKNRSVQTENVTDTINNETVPKTKELKDKAEDSGWTVNEENETKSLADQVKEVAQHAIEQTGMVYVESAGMYYDYKTGYYYNSELGLYYHTDTDCYYTYTEDKKNFVFHSYPVRSAASAALQAHEKRKARKHKMDRKAEEDIDNLTKNLSQGGQEDANEESKPKRKRSKKKADKKPEKKESSPKPENKTQEDVSSLNAEKKPQKEISSPNAEKKLQEEISSPNPEMKSHEEVPSPNTEIKFEQEVSSPKAEDNQVEPSEQAEVKTENTSENVEVKQEAQDVTLKAEKTDELEDGECSDTGSEGSVLDDEEADDDVDVKSNASTSTASNDESVARQLPPCMRIIVRETKLPKLRVGSLFIVTKDGGTVGREGEHHTILLRDHNVSRDHLDIRYDAAYNSYMAIDLGSKNGSVLNGKRMSESQVYSEPMMIMHGSILELGETKLLCHIHPGNDTCGHCEPGLVMETTEKETKVAYTRTCSVRKQHELELARLKNKYGAKPMLAIEETAYNDRAQARRETMGSSHPAEKTQASDIEVSIAPDNKGFKLLEKMGWNKGEGLGKDSQGDVEPVPLISNAGKTGLGATQATQPIAFTRTSKIGPATLRLASRTKMLQPPAKAFQGIFDEDSE